MAITQNVQKVILVSSTSALSLNDSETIDQNNNAMYWQKLQNNYGMSS